MSPLELATVAAENKADSAVRLDRVSDWVQGWADDRADPAVPCDSESLESSASPHSEEPLTVSRLSRLDLADGSPNSEESVPNLLRIRLSRVELTFVKLPSDSAVD